ncbi:MAG: lmo0937 family membrane protein [Planctomycetia bacterium]|nr:lmo0937 family membrane protein [Planctomycetia bacterium]
MLLIIAAVLVVLWILGLATSTTLSGFIHILLVIAIVIIVLRLFRGRKS